MDPQQPQPQPQPQPQQPAEGAAAAASAPVRCIFTEADMAHFRTSQARSDLLGFATALGRSCCSAGGGGEGGEGGGGYSRYDPANPLEGLSPTLASLHGSLGCIEGTWMGDVAPPDPAQRRRFGDPAFRDWHACLVRRSGAIVRAALGCHRRHAAGWGRGDAGDRGRGGRGRGGDGDAGTEEGGSRGDGGGICGNDDGGGDDDCNGDGGAFPMEVLRECSEAGYAAAAEDPPPPGPAAPRPAAFNAAQQQQEEELRAYLHQAFGHPVRIDYGTGHESSFLTFLLCLCKLRCVGDGTNPPEARHLAPVALSVFSRYLEVCRGLQRGYMLEPAGSHGVWGLDDYHCLPFYFGSCQLQALEGGGGGRGGGRGGSGGGGSGSSGSGSGIVPESIHDDALLRSEGGRYMYLGCIRYVKELKSSAPFFESSPMLDDISHLPTWGRVSRGLLRLYEGEVLDKRPVVQHFLFGTMFAADWTPSPGPPEAPSRTFAGGPPPGGGAMPPPTRAPWAGSGAAGPGPPMPPTRAPWAK